MRKTRTCTKRLLLKFKKLISTGKQKTSRVLINEYSLPNKKKTSTYINVKINDNTIKTVADSGSGTTLLSNRLLKLLDGYKLSKVTDFRKFEAANGSGLEVEGTCEVDMSIGSHKLTVNCTVVNNLSVDLILGTDLFVSHGAILNFREKTLAIGDTVVKIFTEEESTFSCLITPRRINLKPNSEYIEWIKAPKAYNESILIDCINFKGSVEVKGGLFNCSDGFIPVIFRNNSRFREIIKKGTHLGTMETVTVNQIQEQKEITGSKKASELMDFSRSELSTDELFRIKALIDKYDHVFSKNEHDLGYCDTNGFKIDTGTAAPIKSRAYRIPYAQQHKINALISDMLKHKIISKSNSPWASPIVLIKKKDGTDRFCIDYRKLNKITVKDNYPVPLIEETIDSLEGSKYFTTLDMSSGYWQMALDESAKEKTAFISNKGLFHFEVLPFGLSNAVASFQRTMEEILEGLGNTKNYLDDIMTHSKNFNDHLEHVEKVFKRLEGANLKLKPSKCTIGTKKTKFLGFDISEKGIRPNEDKLKAIQNYPRPRNPKEIKRFLGMASYYRKFIPKYSSLTEPINRLLKKSCKFLWSMECEEGFKEIIYLLTHPPVLAFPDLERKFHLTTDASKIGLGAVLSQYDDRGDEKVVGYASRLLNQAEKNYSATELECLAIVWACEQFRVYLLGKHFIINSDHNPLVYLDNTKNKSSRVTRWRLSLAEFDKEIVYKKGSENTNADALSRIEIETNKKEVNDADVINCVIVDHLSQFENIKEEQRKDLKLLTIIKNCSGLKDPLYKLVDSVLYKVKKSNKTVLMNPNSLVEVALHTCHNDMGGGHLGFKKTWPKIRECSSGKQCIEIQCYG